MSEEAAGLQSLVIDTRQHTWTNRHQTYTQKLLGIYDIWNPTGGGSPLDRYNATTRGLQELIAALFVTSSPILIKAALEMTGLIPSGRLRLPLVEATPVERDILRTVLERQGILSRAAS